MAILIGPETFEGGSNGAAMSTSNTFFTTSVAADFTFSNTQVVTPGGGSLSGRLNTTLSRQATAPFTATATPWLSFYFYLVTTPSANMSLAQIRATTTLRAELRLNTTRALALRNSASTVIHTATTVLTLNTWTRIDWRYSNTGAIQQLRFFVGSNVHGTTPDYDSGNVTSTAAGTADNFTFGTVTAATTEFFFDNMTVRDDAFQAPSYTPPRRPAATVSNPAVICAAYR